MRRFVIAALALLALTASPAGAHPGKHHFTATAVPCAVACPYWLDQNACDPAAQPSVSFVDIVTEPAPSAPGATAVLAVEMSSQVDWDMYLCDENGRELMAPTPILPACDGPLGLFGCDESVLLIVSPGQVVTIRLFNWLDPGPATGWWQHWLF